VIVARNPSRSIAPPFVGDLHHAIPIGVSTRGSLGSGFACIRGNVGRFRLDPGLGWPLSLQNAGGAASRAPGERGIATLPWTGPLPRTARATVTLLPSPAVCAPLSASICRHAALRYADAVRIRAIALKLIPLSRSSTMIGSSDLLGLPSRRVGDSSRRPGLRGCRDIRLIRYPQKVLSHP